MKPLSFLLFLAIATTLATPSDFLHIDQALKQSAADNKPVMLVFSGSDWCKPCIQLKKEILETEAFSETADHLILLYLDFPYRKANQLSKEETRHNEELAERYNKDGYFPKIIFVDGDGQIIQEILYEKGMSKTHFIANIKKIISRYGNDKS